MHDGDERVDAWVWLGDRDEPEVLAYLEVENAYTRRALAHLTPLRTELLDEIVGRVQETDTTAPIRRGTYEYYTRTLEGLQYGVHCRRSSRGGALPDPAAAPGTADDEVVVLDENALAAGHDYFAVGDLAVNPDQTVVAYSTDTNGGERYQLSFRAVAGDGSTAADLADVVPDLYYGVAWATTTTIFYTRPDDAMRPWQIWRTASGRRTATTCSCSGGRRPLRHRRRAKRRFGRSPASKVTSEVWLVDADISPGHDRGSASSHGVSRGAPGAPATASTCSPTPARRTSRGHPCATGSESWSTVLPIVDTTTRRQRVRGFWCLPLAPLNGCGS